MRLRLCAAAALLLTLGCGGDDDDKPSAPTSCDPITQRVGTYLEEFTEVGSGTCGPQTPTLVRLDGPLDGCTLTADDQWSNGGCTLERSVRCDASIVAAGATAETVGISTQQDASGRVITGTETITVVDARGVGICSGTYRVTATRQ